MASSSSSELLRRSREQRRLSRYDKFRDRRPAVLQPQPLEYVLAIRQDGRERRATVSDVRGHAIRRQKARRHRLMERLRAGKLSHPTLTI